jgi:hypothetical protein
VDKHGIAITGKAAVEPVSNDFAFLTEVVIPTQTIPTSAAYVATWFGGYFVTDFYVASNGRSLFNNDPAEFMAENDGCPDGIVDVIMVDMQIRPTDATDFNLDFHLIGFRGQILHVTKLDKTVTAGKFHHALHFFASGFSGIPLWFLIPLAWNIHPSIESLLGAQIKKVDSLLSDPYPHRHAGLWLKRHTLRIGSTLRDMLSQLNVQ